jgi:hypothetical protein
MGHINKRNPAEMLGDAPDGNEMVWDAV